MEPETDGKHKIPLSFDNVATALLAFVATTSVWLRIAIGWATFDWLGRSLAIVLASGLVIIPTSVFLIWKSGRGLRLRQVVGAGYMWLLLATLLFTR